MHQFDRDMDLETLEESIFSGTITDEWSINGNPNGGYLMALMMSAMIRKSEKKHPSILTANFLTRTECKKSQFDVEMISQSKSFNRIQAKLLQDGNERVRAWGTFSDEENCPGEKRYEQKEPDIAALEDCIPIPEFGRYTLYKNMDVRLDPSCAGWFQGNLTDISEHKGWIRFKEPRSMDALAVILMADSFPPPVLSSQGMVAWVPTIEFSVNIRSIPKSTWLKACFRSRYITCGQVEEDGELWDENSELVAICRQIAQFRKAS